MMLLSPRIVLTVLQLASAAVPEPAALVRVDVFAAGKEG
jgi:hypothetical protein